MSDALPALVLAAGLGTRLDPVTRLVAKPAVPLAGRTLIERVLEWLAREGIRDVVLNLHHRPQTIAAIVGDGAHAGMRVRYSWEPVLLGSAGGPRHALPLLDSDAFVIVNGDTLCDVALAPMIDSHRREHALVTMAVIPNPAPDRYNGIAADPAGRVSAFVPKGAGANGTWHFVGIQIAAASVFATLADGERAETVSGVYRDLVARQPGRVRVWPVTSRFHDVGTPHDYLEAARHFALNDRDLVEPGATVEPDARVERSVVWREARVRSRAVLTECIVAGPVDVPAGFEAERAVLVPASIVRPGDRAEVRGQIGLFPV